MTEQLVLSKNGSYLITETPEYLIEVHRMLFNFRVLLTLAGDAHYTSGFCYFGTTADTLVTAVAAARAWTDPLNTEPIGHNKKAF